MPVESVESNAKGIETNPVNEKTTLISVKMQPKQTLSTSDDKKLMQLTSNSNETQIKETDSQPDPWKADATVTDPIIQTEEAPNGTISSARSLSETAIKPDGFCRRRPNDMTKRKILKNVLVVSLVFLLTFMSYGGLAALQSSLHVTKGMGVLNQAVVYASMALSCIFLPKVAIRFLGHKVCMSVSLIGYLLWMAANGFGSWATMLPASITVGICAATLWTSHSSYFTILARHYAVKTNQETAPVTALFFGIFGAIFANYNLFGSIISSTILGRSSSASSNHDNQTAELDEELLKDWCGLNDCPGSSPSNSTLFSKPPSSLIWTLVGVYVAIGTVAFLICCLFVDPLPRSWVRNSTSPSSSSRQVVLSSLLATVKQLRHVKQLLLIPITIYVGMEQSFLDADYTRSFVSCFLAIWMVGWCLIPASICKSLGSFLSGRVTRYTGVIPVFVCGLLLDLSFQLTLWLWTPSALQLSLFFIIPVLNALADSIWMVQLRALYGVLFAHEVEAAFSCFQLFTACGSIIAFSYSSFLCTRVKLQILTSMLVLGLTLLFLVILVFRRKLARPVRQ